MEIEELKTAVKEAAEEVAGERLNALEEEVASLKKTLGELEEVGAKAEKALATRRSIDTDDEGDVAPKGTDRRRDSLGRRLRSA